MKITVMGLLIVIGMGALLVLIVYRIGQEVDKRTGNSNEQPNNNAEPNSLS